MYIAKKQYKKLKQANFLKMFDESPALQVKDFHGSAFRYDLAGASMKGRIYLHKHKLD